MSYQRQPLLSPEVEQQLKEEMYPLWKSGVKGKKIAEQLQFGVKETLYKKVNPKYIFFYRQKFEDQHQKNSKENPLSFSIRRKPAFAKRTKSASKKLPRTRYRYPPGKIGMLPINEFIEALNKKLPQNISSFYYKRSRAFLITLYHTPLRSSEIYERTIDDFEITTKKIVIHLLRKKKGRNRDVDDEPISIPRLLPLVEELVDWLESDRWKYNNSEMRPFKMTWITALRYVRSVFPKRYPHYFRFRFISEEADQPGATPRKLMQKTKLTIGAVNRYIITDEKTEEEIDEARIERYKKEGAI